MSPFRILFANIGGDDEQLAAIDPVGFPDLADLGVVDGNYDGLVDADGSTPRAPEETAASRARTEADPDRPKEYANRHGCLAPTEPDATGATWTELVAPKAGTYRIAAPYEIPRGTACPEELR